MPVVVSASVLAAGLSACGTVEQLSAAQKVSKAFDKLGASTSAGVTVSVEASPEQIVAYGKATGDEIEPRSAEALSGLNISVAMASDKPLRESSAFKDASGAGGPGSAAPDKSLRASYVVADRKGTALFEYRQVDAKAYLRADAKGLVKLVGEDPAQVDEVGRELPGELGAIRDVLAGKWVALDLQELADSAKKSGPARPPAPTGRPTLDPNSAKQLTESLKDVFSRTVTFEDKGKKDGAEHVLMSAPARKLIDGVLGAVKPLSAKFPGQFGKLPATAPADVPDKAIGVDLYLKDGRFASATFDLAQLEPGAGPGAAFPVKLAFDQTAPVVQAPAGAVRVSEKDLQNTVLAFAGTADEDGFPGPGSGPVTRPGDGARPGPGKPLTDAQVKELIGLGMTESQIEIFNELGMDFAEIKSLAQEG
ncbi:hypothetical protein [Kitasatospora sp. NPDC090091]|uniref:hypothetical protein n=1 Tax=Kitasatospora sp. NPDC090091 TaxID=3364081 RepID=UPI0037FF1742